MDIAPFAIEEYFARYEFTTPHLLCSSDCQSMTVTELLALSGVDAAGLGRLWLGYTESQGHPELRAAVSRLYADVSPDEIVALAAPEEGIYLTMRALLEPGDEVVVLSPAYQSLRSLAGHICGSERVRSWWLRPSPGAWRLDPDELASLVTPRTKLVVLNFPHNPTGYLPAPAEFQAILDIAGRHGASIFCDEMYRGLELYGRETLASAVALADRCLVLGGLSKVYGLPGLRTGWLVVRDPALRQRLISWKHYTTICAPAPSEFLATAALQMAGQLAQRSRQIIERNLALAGPFFARWSALFTWRPPQAGSVALVGLSHPSATDYCHRLAAEAGVLLLPGAFLGYDDHHVRFGFGRTSFAEALDHYEQFLLTAGPTVNNDTA